MTDTDDMRNKLTVAVAASTDCQPSPVYDEDLDADTWDGAFCAKHLDPWPCDAGRTTDNLWPVVREALADAWDDGYCTAAPDARRLYPEDRAPNPWREDDS